MGLSVRGYPVPDDEAARLASLHALDILYSPQDADFDAVVALACDMFHVPVAVVSLIAENEQWFKARQGLDVCSTDRGSAFCNYPVASGKMLVVADATLDPRFAGSDLVGGAPHIRFYAGVPLSIDPGLYLGALCIIDTKPRDFSATEEDQLRRLAEIVTSLLRKFKDSRALARQAFDLDQQRRLIKEQADTVGRYKSLFDRASTLTHMGAWELLPEGQLTWTDGMYDLHELPRGSIVTPSVVHEYYPVSVRADVQRLLEATDGGRYVFEGPMRTAKGNKRWIRLTGDTERNEDGTIARRFGVKQDITAQKTVWDRMRFLAECDPLTKLANRGTFEKRLRRHSRSARASRGLVALLLIDVDGFKLVNDTFGHAVGDECLRQIARRLRRVSRDVGMLARLGGDEFALLFEEPKEQHLVEKCAERILAELRRPIRWEGQSFQLSGSVGVAISNETADATSGLFTEADLALYAAKAAGRNTFCFFTTDMKLAAEKRFETVKNITKALEDDQLELFYQPKIDLTRDELSGFEALLRWRRPDGKVIAAAEFTEALDDPELSHHLGKMVVEKALGQAEAWHKAGLKFGHIAINLSSSQLRNAQFAEDLIDGIAARGLEPRMIEVEVTEGVFLNQETGVARQILETLRRAGIRIALDDFGTGYASLSHLRTYPVDIIKIDRSFVQHFLTSHQDHAILQSTLFLARQLRIDVVAEGIEETDQCEFLEAMGCRYGQGYLYSKAVCAAEASEWCLPAFRRALVG